MGFEVEGCAVDVYRVFPFGDNVQEFVDGVGHQGLCVAWAVGILEKEGVGVDVGRGGGKRWCGFFYPIDSDVFSM